jgi:flagellar hook-basal body complex protein FliE
MSIPAVGGVGFTPYVPQTLPTSSATPASLTGDTSSVGGASSASGADFGSLLSQGLSGLQGMHSKTESLALQAATGDLNAIHDYTIQATETQVATQLTTAVRNKALESFNEIMRMNV